MTSVATRAGWKRLLLLSVWGLSAVYAFRNLDRGWIPHDEGTLAESAERVMEGQFPHRDFDELYTGGLSAMNAVAFDVLGVNLLTPRLVLFAFFLLWVPVLFWVLSRLVPLPLAALATLLAVSWSIPNYPAAMPSWYNLFFSIFGLAALLRHLETDRRRWLVAAGLAGGFSVLVKTSGLFFVAAALLTLAYREQETSATGPVRPEAASAVSGHVAFSLGSTVLLVAFVGLLGLLVTREGTSAAEILQFVAPLGALVAFLVWTEWRLRRATGSIERLRALARLGLPFLAGIAVPLGALLAVYAMHGALHDLARGLFEMPRRRLVSAATAPPGPATWWVVAPFFAVLIVDALRHRRTREAVAVAILAAGAGVALAPAAHVLLPPAWYLLNALGPVVALLCVAVLVRDQLGDVRSLERQRLLAAAAVAGGALLIQFPFSGAIYLFYALPAVVPAALATGQRSGPLDRPVLASIVVLLLLFTVRWVNTGRLFRAGHFAYDPMAATVHLALPRGGGLRVSPAQKEEYEKLTSAMRSLSTSKWTFATPDVPEVYFLSGLRNPTRTLFDFFDRHEGRSARILTTLDAHHVNVVVLNRRLRFSGPPPPDLLDGLRTRFPDATIIGDFILRWRPGSAAAPQRAPVPRRPR